MSVSAQQLRKIYSRRRVVAINFLSNISLDGSPTKKDVVRQRMVQCGGNNLQSSQAKSEEQPTNGAELICCELEGEKNELGKERSNTCGSDCKHNRASTYDQSSSLASANNPRQRTSSGQVYARSVSSQEAEQQSAVANPSNLSMKSFISPGGGMKLQTSVSVDRRSEGAGGGEAMSVMSLANAVGSRLKAQLTKMDGDVTCSFDALRAFGLVRTTEKKTVISFGSLLSSSPLPKLSKQPSQPLTVARASGNGAETTKQPNSPLSASSIVSRTETTSNAQQTSTPTKSDRSLAVGTQSQLTVSWTPSGAVVNKVAKQGVSTSSHGAGVQDVSASVNYVPTIFDEMVSQAVARAARLNSSQNELKRMMNEQFRLRFPSLQITLSKLQSLKRELAQVARKCAIEPAIVACAYVFFEKLVLSALIRKDNRKPCCGACLLLSAKLNDVRDEPLTTLIKELEQTFRIARREILAYEVAILVALEFNLNAPLAFVRPHYLRLVDAN